MINDKGFLLEARQLFSPNKSARPQDVAIDLLVIHGISLPPGQFGGGYVQKLFTNQLPMGEHSSFIDLKSVQVSSHLLIERIGQVTQFVSFLERAWHAGESMFGGRKDCNDFSIGIELEGTDYVPYASEQYQVLADVTHHIMKAYPQITLDHIVGHSDIAPGRKTDPGPRFDWKHYRNLLNKL